MQFEQVKNLLVEIQSDKALQMKCFKEAENLYGELFVIEDSFTGNDVIESLKNESEFNRDSTINAYLHNILIFEKNMINAEIASKENGSHIYTEYLNILNQKAEALREYENLKNEMYENEDYDEYVLDNFFEEEYSEEEFLSKKEYLYDIFKTTEFCCLCNYKGEIESDDLKINTIHLRKFYGKYDYS